LLTGTARGDRRGYCSGWIDRRCRVRALDLMVEDINREGMETEDRIPASSQPPVRLFAPLHLAVFQGDRCCDWSEHIARCCRHIRARHSKTSALLRFYHRACMYHVYTTFRCNSVAVVISVHWHSICRLLFLETKSGCDAFFLIEHKALFIRQ
jgi:hypothetical protein